MRTWDGCPVRFWRCLESVRLRRGWGAGGFEPGIKVCEFLRAGFVSDQQQKGHFFKGGIRREIRDFVSAIDQLGLVDYAN